MKVEDVGLPLRARVLGIAGHVPAQLASSASATGHESIMIGSADFTDLAAAFARQHGITVLGRAEIKK